MKIGKEACVIRSVDCLSKPDRTSNGDSRAGGMLIVLSLFFAVVGILFGLGRLKAHELQVKRRLERQYEIDKILATRSALNMIRSTTVAAVTGESFAGFTNSFASGMGQDLEVRVVPVPPLLRADMGLAEKTNWIKKASMPTRVDFDVDPALPASTSSDRVVKFSCITGSVERSCAIFKQLPVTWLKTQFGLIYRLDPGYAAASNGFSRLGLSLVGMGGPQGHSFGGVLTAGNLDNAMSACPAIMLETTAISMGTHGESVSRNFKVINMPASGCADMGIGNCINNNDCKLVQASGFLLSGYNAVAFAENSLGDMIFSDSLPPLKGLVDDDAFTNSWIVIKHTFPANFAPGSNATMTVTFDSFDIREPKTFAVSVFNREIEKKAEQKGANFIPDVSTWTLMTSFPNGMGGLGQSCVIDTFGAEANSLWLERRGEDPRDKDKQR